jgi:hypothetical protein
MGNIKWLTRSNMFYLMFYFTRIVLFSDKYTAEVGTEIHENS